MHSDASMPRLPPSTSRRRPGSMPAMGTGLRRCGGVLAVALFRVDEWIVWMDLTTSRVLKKCWFSGALGSATVPIAVAGAFRGRSNWASTGAAVACAGGAGSSDSHCEQFGQPDEVDLVLRQHRGGARQLALNCSEHAEAESWKFIPREVAVAPVGAFRADHLRVKIGRENAERQAGSALVRLSDSATQYRN